MDFGYVCGIPPKMRGAAVHGLFVEIKGSNSYHSQFLSLTILVILGYWVYMITVEESAGESVAGVVEDIVLI